MRYICRYINPCHYLQILLGLDTQTAIPALPVPFSKESFSSKHCTEVVADMAVRLYFPATHELIPVAYFCAARNSSTSFSIGIGVTAPYPLVESAAAALAYLAQSIGDIPLI